VILGECVISGPITPKSHTRPRAGAYQKLVKVSQTASVKLRDIAPTLRRRVGAKGRHAVILRSHLHPLLVRRSSHNSDDVSDRRNLGRHTRLGDSFT